MKLFGQVSLLLFAMAATAVAQNMSYGADNFYTSDIVTVQPVSFPTLFRTAVAGNLYIRNKINRTNLPAIVVGHPFGAVKEQSANLYATKLAEQGFVTLSIDLPHWGGSEGEPRNGVSPDYYAEVFSAAVDFLGTRDFVDRRGIGALGICGSGGFVVSAAKIDPRLKAIATTSMYDMGAVNRNGLRFSQSLAQRKEYIADSAHHRWVEAEGGPTRYTIGTPNELPPDADDVTLEFWDYYRTSRAEFTPDSTTRNLTTHRTLTSNVKFMNFYPFNDIESISPRPLLFISGDLAHSREFSEDAYERAAEPKELFWVTGAGHVDLYDRIELIPFAKLTDFFRDNLVGTPGCCN